MNTVQRFFRRYVFSMVGTMILFFAVNIVLYVCGGCIFQPLVSGGLPGKNMDA